MRAFTAAHIMLLILRNHNCDILDMASSLQWSFWDRLQYQCILYHNQSDSPHAKSVRYKKIVQSLILMLTFCLLHRFAIVPSTACEQICWGTCRAVSAPCHLHLKQGKSSTLEPAKTAKALKTLFHVSLCLILSESSGYYTFQTAMSCTHSSKGASDVTLQSWTALAIVNGHKSIWLFRSQTLRLNIHSTQHETPKHKTHTIVAHTKYIYSMKFYCYIKTKQARHSSLNFFQFARRSGLIISTELQSAKEAISYLLYYLSTLVQIDAIVMQSEAEGQIRAEREVKVLSADKTGHQCIQCTMHDLSQRVTIKQHL